MALLSILFLLSIGGASSASALSICPDESDLFLYDIQSQCPVSISPNPPLQVDGDFLDRALTSKQRNAYTSVLFYASWCPFSCSMLPKFEILSSMFPQIEHLAVEQSSALPSVFSRYGIHSLPSILIVNQRSKVLYRGPKNLQSLAQFYKKTTGLEPVQLLTKDDSSSTEGHEKSILQPWNGPSSEEIIKREPYLALATLFLCLRVLLYASPKALSHLKAFYVSYIPHFNLEIFGETSQFFGRILHMIDVRRIWTKLRLFKTRNFHERAKNCRVWASSLASVSLGESSSSTRSQS
ncbi:5'-adenylylsulfate reductase-like 5 [Populus alba x Populus x berolinensis]|uniref:5'-adenylylsulfate reductase-like 5 n=1 Tax=Populus alba x Populus x berolinensis TaxID=444605 RepID=A0AAD6Q0R2_9ROSI|nr:5'-adenylylsulfate reductase-like 5 [Populus alba x Populus x berolinensis]